MGSGVGQEVQRHQDVLARGEERQQVARLKHVADPPAHARLHFGRRAAQLLAGHAQAAFLHCAQGADERQQRGLPRTARAGDERQLAGPHLNVHVVEDGLAAQAVPVGVEEVPGCDGWFHGQNMSAGLAARSRCMASAPDSRHIVIVSTRTNVVFPAPSSMGRPVALAVR